MNSLARSAMTRPAYHVVVLLLFVARAGAVHEAYASIEPGVELVATTSKEVVAVGESLHLDIQLYAVAAEKGWESVLREALAAGAFEDGSPGLEEVRRGEVEADFTEVDPGSSVLRLTLRLVLRPLETGTIRVPPFVVDVDSGVLSTRELSIYSYRPTPELHSSRNSIVPIFVERRDPVTREKIKRTGTAFFVSADAIVTSYHVVFDAAKVYVVLPNGHRLGTDRVWSVDPVRDVAILYVDPAPVAAAGVEPLELYPVERGMDMLRSSRAVFTYGWPGGLRRSTVGIRFDGARLGYDRAWVSSNAVGPGDSGGPLLTGSGQVIGVVTLGTAVDSRSDVLREEVCIANDPRPAIGLMNGTLGPRSMKSTFGDKRFRQRPYVQAFRLLAMIGQRERFDDNLRGALENFERSILSRSSDPGLHFMRGMVYQMLGTRNEANDSFAHVLKLFEAYFPATYLLGVDRFQSGMMREAVEYFQRTMTAEPYQHLAQYGLARSLIKLHRYEQAMDLLQDVIVHDPDFAPALYSLALCRFALGDRDGLTIARARLGQVSPAWKKEFDRAMTIEVLRPRLLIEMPRAAIRADARL